jgi:hypothetical protein
MALCHALLLHFELQPCDNWAWAWEHLFYVLSLHFYDMLFAGRIEVLETISLFISETGQ